jgi:hypothetical protein
MEGEAAIMLPAYIDDSHWLAIVRREINNKVLFLYADDMNNQTTEKEIKSLILQHTNNTFFPPDAQWIKVKTTYYTPHSNECGPRTLLALHIMATHPNPTDEILTHLMHPNLAQITRSWIAISIIMGKLHDTDLYCNKVSEQDVTFSYTDTCIPKDLINWSEHNTNTPDSMHIQEHSQSIPSCLSMQDYYLHHQR